LPGEELANGSDTGSSSIGKPKPGFASDLLLGAALLRVLDAVGFADVNLKAPPCPPFAIPKCGPVEACRPVGA
jgi:hypothetical protein